MSNKQQGGGVVARMTIKPPQRKVLDVGAWRRALKAADQDAVKELYELYEDILLDTHLSNSIGKRIDAVLESELKFVDEDKEEVEEIADLMDSLEWEELLTSIMRTRFWGRAGMELSFSDRFSVAEIPAKHIDMKREIILLKDTDRAGIPYQDDPFLVVLGKRRDYGLLLKVAPYAIYKRGGFADWAQWIEIFGMPQRVGKYNLHDPATRAALEEAMQRAGSAPWITAPEGTEIEHIETSGGNGVAYDDFRKACNEEMDVAILGQTLTTTQGDTGARALGEVHAEVEASKYRSDLRYTQRILNQYILPRLEARGYPVAGGKFVFPKASEPLSVSDIMQLSDIMDIPKTYLHERYAIPIAQSGEEIARRTGMGMYPTLPDEDDIEDDEPEANEPQAKEKVEAEGKSKPQQGAPKKPIRNSDELGFWGRMMRFFGFAPSLTLGASTSALPTIDIRLADAQTINDRLIERTILGELGDFDVELWRWTSDRLITALQRGFNAPVTLDDVETTYGAQRDALITAMEINLYRFGAAKTLAEAQHLNQLFRESKSLDDFRARARDILGKYNGRWLETEYNTAHLSALSAAKYQELKTKAQLYPYWQYKTVGDSRVRAEHAALDGVILRHDDPLWDEIYPPNGYGCRCTVEPRLAHEGRSADIPAMRQRVKTYQEGSDWQAAKAMGWDSNRATLGEVFDKNQQYTSKMPGKSAANLDTLTAAQWGLPSISKQMRDKPERPTTAKTRDEVWAELGGGEAVELRDYADRRVIIKWDDYAKHTDPQNSKYNKRTTLLDAALETLKGPDEVWLNYQHHKTLRQHYKLSKKLKIKKPSSQKVGQNGYSLIKYYKGEMILVRYRIEPEGIIIKSWYSVKLTKEVINEQRRGLLIKAKNKEGEP